MSLEKEFNLQQEVKELRQQLATAQAAIKAKDDYIKLLSEYTSESTVASLILQKALAVNNKND